MARFDTRISISPVLVKILELNIEKQHYSPSDPTPKAKYFVRRLKQGHYRLGNGSPRHVCEAMLLVSKRLCVQMIFF